MSPYKKLSIIEQEIREMITISKKFKQNPSTDRLERMLAFINPEEKVSIDNSQPDLFDKELRHDSNGG